MSTLTIILVVLVIGAVGAFLGYRRGSELQAEKAKASEKSGKGGKPHSRPIYHASYIVSWSVIPALLTLAVWLIASPLINQYQVRSAFPEGAVAEAGLTADLAYNLIDSLGNGLRAIPENERSQITSQTALEDAQPIFRQYGVPTASASQDWMLPLAVQRNAFQDISRWAMTAVVILIALAGAFYGYRNIRLRLRARNKVESVVNAMLVVASSIAIMTTIGIAFSLIYESGDFFSRVDPWSFFFGTTWEPRFSGAGSSGDVGQFGLIPLLAGTLYIGAVAMLVAVPIGLFAAVYMAEYAGNHTRSFAKPLLEVLAGIPTIVYGFFALVTVGPFFRDLSAQIAGLATGNYAPFIQAQSVLTAGVVMGIMLIPFVSSLSDDIITSVPQSLRDGSLGLGATQSETIKRVILPAALPGIVSAILLTASRAIGETMIVVLAAGVAANLTINPFEAMTTITVKIVQQLTGDLVFTSPQTLVAFALGITLFAITLCLNVYALYIVRKYKEQYE